MDAQNDMRSQIAVSHKTGTGTDLALGDWDPASGTYSSIEVRDAGANPGTGIPLKTYPDDRAKQPQTPPPFDGN